MSQKKIKLEKIGLKNIYEKKEDDLITKKLN